MNEVRVAEGGAGRTSRGDFRRKLEAGTAIQPETGEPVWRSGSQGLDGIQPYLFIVDAPERFEIAGRTSRLDQSWYLGGFRRPDQRIDGTNHL